MRLYPLGQKVGTDYIPSRPFRAMFFKDIVVSLKNPHDSVALQYYIRGCLDPRIWHEAVATAETPNSISAEGSAKHSTSAKETGGVPDIEKGYAWLQVMVKVDAGSGEVEGYIAGQK